VQDLGAAFFLYLQTMSRSIEGIEITCKFQSQNIKNEFQKLIFGSSAKLKKRLAEL